MKTNRFLTGLLTASVIVAGAAHAGFDDLMKSAGGLLNSPSATTAGRAGGSLSDGQINAGLKEALSVGAERAVSVLGSDGGFLNDASVRIPLPGVLGSAAKGLRAAGQGKYVDALETTMNRAAEEAVPETLGIVKDTVKNMTLDDVRGILGGGDDAATQFLRKRAGGSMRKAVLPIVSRATDSAGATVAYKTLKTQADGAIGGLGSLGGLVNTNSLDLDGYVTDKALDGLFLKLAAEEKAIRQNPLARSTDLLKTVFGK